MRIIKNALLVGLLGAACANVMADINIGVVVSATGPAASLGIPEKNTIGLLPTTIAGQKVNYIILDDASDTTSAVKNTRKLITEDKVDVIIGSTITPNSLAMIDIAAEAQTPVLSLAASSKIVEPMDAKRSWIFKTPANDIQMALAIAEHMRKTGHKNVGFIGFADFAFGPVKLDAVTVKRDVAARDHDAGAAHLQGTQCQSGCGQTACPVGLQTFCQKACTHSGGNVGAAGAQVPTDDAMGGVGLQLPCLAQVLNEHAHIGGDHGRGEV